MKWICSLTSTIRPRTRLLRGAVGRTPNFSEVSAQVLRSTPQSSQKYRAKFSEVSNQVLRTWGQYREYTQNPHNNKKKQVLRTHGQSSQNPRPKFSELAGKVLKEVGDVVQNFANRRGRVIFQVAGAVARCTELNLLADATTEIKWWNWNKIEVESHEKTEEASRSRNTKNQFFQKAPRAGSQKSVPRASVPKGLANYVVAFETSLRKKHFFDRLWLCRVARDT